MGLFRKKPVVIEAVRFDGKNYVEIGEFTAGYEVDGRKVQVAPGVAGLIIPTLEGEHGASPGDWIIKGVKGEFYPCKPDIFAATYEEVNARPIGSGTPEEFDNLRGMYSAAQSREAEREMTGLHTFGWAIKQMQNGIRVQREGWNEMYLYLDRGAIRTALAVAPIAGAVFYEPCIVMFTQGRYQPGWAASQADMLAADWRIAPEVTA